MQITILRLCLGLLLLAIPVGVITYLRLRLLRELLTAFVRMAVSLCLTGVFLGYVMQMGSSWLNVLWIVLLALLASWSVIRKARLRTGRFLLPVTAGVLLSTVTVGFYLLFVVLEVGQPFDPRYWIPVFGLLIGHMVRANSDALSIYYMGLKHHHQLYLYLTGNGATHREAVDYFTKRALEKNMKPALSGMAYMTVSVCPVILWAMILAGADLLTAVESQLLLVIGAFAASTVSLIITLFVGRKYLFDDYERLRKESFE